MKHYFPTLFAIFCSALLLEAQDFGNFSGGFESNSQWLQDDTDIGFFAPEEQFRSNNYFLLNYN